MGNVEKFQIIKMLISGRIRNQKNSLAAYNKQHHYAVHQKALVTNNTMLTIIRSKALDCKILHKLCENMNHNFQ